MSTPHLTEPELQHYAEAPLAADAFLRAHVQGCAQCQAAVATYQALFGAVAALPPPTLDFDLATQVVANLPVARRAFPWTVVLLGGWLLSLLAGGVVVSWPMLTPLLRSLSPISWYWLAGGAAVWLFGQGIETVAAYRRQLSALKFST